MTINIKRIGRSTLLDTRNSAPSEKSSSNPMGHFSHSNNALLFIVYLRKPDPAIMQEAWYDKAQAIMEFKTYGFRPERFTTYREGTITL